MDLTRAVAYRGAALNTAAPAVGKPGATGCIVEAADVSNITHAEFSERLREQDGLNVIEPYTALQTVTMQGSLFASTRGALFSALQDLRETFHPMKALLESPSTKGFLPLTYYEPHDIAGVSAKTLLCRPMGLHWSVDPPRIGTAAKVAARIDDTALALRWTVQLIVDLNPPTPYDHDAEGGDEGPPVDSWPPPPEDILSVWECEPPDLTVINECGEMTTSCQILPPPEWDGVMSAVSTCKLILYLGATYHFEVDCWINDNGAVWGPGGSAYGINRASTLGWSVAPRGAPFCSPNPHEPSTEWTCPTDHPRHMSLTFLNDHLTADYQAFITSVNSVNNSTLYSRMDIVLTYVSGPDPRFVGLPQCANTPPVSGQRVRNPDIDGSAATAYTTMFPYRPRSLVVRVGGTVVPSSETDPASGAFSIVAPGVGTVISATYVRA